MNDRAVSFPFSPRSTAFLRPGQFWPVRLSDGRYSAAAVLVVKSVPGDTWSLHTSRVFTAGLLSWLSSELPTAKDLDGADLVDWGGMHVGAIARHGEQILGAWDGIETLTPIRKVSHRIGGTIGLFSNGHLERTATVDEAKCLPVTGTWGPNYLWEIAERVHLRGLPIAH